MSTQFGLTSASIASASDNVVAPRNKGELVVEDVLHTTPRPRTRVAMADAESGGDDARWARVAMAWMDPCRAGCCVASEV